MAQPVYGPKFSANGSSVLGRPDRQIGRKGRKVGRERINPSRMKTDHVSVSVQQKLGHIYFKIKNPYNIRNTNGEIAQNERYNMAP